jgi:hypothetical protein
MRELGVCQHFSDQSAPSCPDQDDISVWSNADGSQPQDLLRCDGRARRLAARVGLSAVRKADRCRDQVGHQVSAPLGRSPSDGRGGGESRGSRTDEAKTARISWITAVIRLWQRELGQEGFAITLRERLPFFQHAQEKKPDLHRKTTACAERATSLSPGPTPVRCWAARSLR